MRAHPIMTQFQGKHLPVATYLFKDGRYWLFYGIEKTALVKKEALAEFLGVTPATLKNWRTGKSPANGALLYLAQIHFTGQIMPDTWCKDGFYFDREILKRTSESMTRQEARSMDFMRWQLKQATDALRSLSRPGFRAESAVKLPAPMPPDITVPAP